jgi:hypothetical protein
MEARMLDLVLILTVLALTAITFSYMGGCDVFMRTDATRDEGKRT